MMIPSGTPVGFTGFMDAWGLFLERMARALNSIIVSANLRKLDFFRIQLCVQVEVRD